MSDHKFEKKVGQKLDDLQLTPSAKSWENIERELRKDKRRPAPVFWLPLLLLGLGAIGYFVFNRNNEPRNGMVTAENSSATALPKADLNELSGQQGKPGVTADETSIHKNGNSTKSGLTTIPNADNELVEKPVSRLLQRPTGIIKDDNHIKTNEKAVSTRESDPVITTIFPEQAKNSTRGIQKSSVVPQLPEVKTDDKQELQAPSFPSEPDSSKEDRVLLTSDEKKGDSVVAGSHKTKNKKIRKWSFGISGSGGVSSLSEGKLSFSSSQIATVPLNRTPVASIVSPSVVPPPAAEPSKIYPAVSFGFGLTTKYEISKRFAISSGVNYLQLNAISKVGYKFQQSYTAINQGFSQDRSVAEVMYLPPEGEQTRDYDNKYHFIELPVNLHTRLNKSDRLPVYWNAGFSVSRLIKSNSLHYDSDEHIYYTDDNLLKKTQTTVSTGFSFVVFNKTSRPLWIGPTVRYNVSQAFKNEIQAGKKHFMGVGLDVKWFIK